MDTRRPTFPAAEEILGGYFPVLDHGFVSLVDYMGSDEDVERAARVSYGYGTRKTSATRGLVRYLRRHRHTTPSEMVELKFHVAMPIFVARQWIRHRTACLAEGTEIYFDLPGGIARRGNQLYKIPIEEIWDRFQPTRNRQRPDKQADPFFKRERIRGMRLRQMDEATGRIRHTAVRDVFRNGAKPVFRMVLADGKAIECTSDHKFVFAEGWNTLAARTGLHEKNGKAVWRAGEYFVHVNGMVREVPPLYRDKAWLEEQYRAAPRIHAGTGSELEYVERLGGPPVRADWKPRPRTPWNKLDQTRLVRVERFEYVGVKETYDLEVEGPFHNFVANGVVTHNSVNEYSARYSLMPLLFYTPRQEDFKTQSRSNRQGRGEGASEELYRGAVERWEEIRRLAGDGYSWLVEEEVAREIARIDLPLSTYTQWYWKIDLHNLLHFLTLRVDPHAQWEIQAFARVMAGMVERVAPLSFEAWVDYDLAGRPLSRGDRAVLARLVEVTGDGLRARAGASLSKDDMEAAGLSPREVRELATKLEAPERPDFSLDLSTMRTGEEVGREMEAAVPTPETAETPEE